jgi:hypothetical protein
LELAGWLNHRLPDEYFADLVDLETGETWNRLPAGSGVAFSEDDAHFITFGEKGRYIWTVPPRTRPFTPWAWAALGAWLGLATCWWMLRRKQPRRVAC